MGNGVEVSKAFNELVLSMALEMANHAAEADKKRWEYLKRLADASEREYGVKEVKWRD